MAEELDNKAELARETCSISSLFSACSHRGRCPRRPPFIDWYLILRVDENAGIDDIRRQYRRLALQLHPDKNRHPKAEAAFKVVSQAYECLSDEVGRKAFNSERQEKFCSECYKLSQPKTGSGSNSGVQTKLRRALAALKEAKKRFQEESRVIEACLKANDACSQSGSPLFDPSLYVVCNDYPHYRDRLLSRPQEHEQFRCSGDGGNCRRKGRCESPLYEFRTEQKPRRTRNNSFKL
ncbi:J domain-containing protein [Canna indica]|uniref:J domain-containing protein n=1 Tax=Canna indica TaxID=4628 RepID=A0AAQ3QA32_9LILI|nr:J domain-containing protein [Canna indica]